MDPLQPHTQEMIWRRVRGSRYDAMAETERQIRRQCQLLYRRGMGRHLMDRIYRESRRREAVLSGMKQVGTAPGPRRGSLKTLSELLGQAAWSYDPEDPEYGPLFSDFRRQCIRAQEAVLLLAAGKRD